MSSKRFWDEAPVDGELQAADHGDADAPADDRSPLFSGELFADFNVQDDSPLELDLIWTPWGDSAIDTASVEREPLETGTGDVAAVFLPASSIGELYGPGLREWPAMLKAAENSNNRSELEAVEALGKALNIDGVINNQSGSGGDHGAGVMYFPYFPAGMSDDDLIEFAHDYATGIEWMKRDAPDDAIDTYLQWIKEDGLPGRIEAHIAKTRPRWHGVIVNRFLPQYPPLWEHDELSTPDGGWDSPAGLQAKFDGADGYAAESWQVMYGANVLHSQTDHAKELLHAAVHDPAAWKEHARDALAHAIVWDDDAPGDDPVSQLATRYKRAVRGPAMARAINVIGMRWGDKALDRYIAALQDDVKQNPARWEDLIIQARKKMGLPAAKITLQAPDAPAPAPRPKHARQIALPFTPTAAYIDGLGHAPTVSAWGRLQSVSWEPWETTPGKWPEQYFVIDRDRGPNGESGEVRFTFQENPNGATETQMAAAIELAQSISPVVGRVAFHLGIAYTKNRAQNGRLIVHTRDIAADVYGGKPTKKQMENVNDAIHILGQLVVQSLIYYKHRKGRKRPDPKRHPAYHLLTWDRLHQNGRNVTYDIRLGTPILAMFRDFPTQVAGVPQGALSLDARRPEITRFAIEIVNSTNLTWTRQKLEGKGLTHREIFEYARIDPGTVKRQNRPSKRNLLDAMIDQPQLWDYKYVPGSNRGMNQMTWDEWLDGPRVQIFLHDHALPDTADDAPGDGGAPVESDPQVHPNWST